MNILFNTRKPNAASSEFYHFGFSLIDNFEFNRYSNLENFDIALFMTYPEDLKDLKFIKLKHPSLKTGIVDPRGDFVKQYLKYTDLLIVDSIEMYDYWLFSGKPIFRYAEYPDVPKLAKIHSDKNELIIGYHGNLVHLDSSNNTILPALIRLAKVYSIEFRIMYNIESLGKWNHPINNAINVRHIQWSLENYKNLLAEADIGIVPNLLPAKPGSMIDLKASFLKRKKSSTLNYRNDDYVLRFKMSSNPGRIIVFGKLGIPVVADFFPSAMQCIRDGINGYLAFSQDGWYNALEKLILDHSLRQVFSERMRKDLEIYDFSNQNYNFVCELKKQFNLN